MYKKEQTRQKGQTWTNGAQGANENEQNVPNLNKKPYKSWKKVQTKWGKPAP